LRELLLVSIPLLVCGLVYLLLMRQMRVQAVQDLTTTITSRLSGLRRHP